MTALLAGCCVTLFALVLWLTRRCLWLADALEAERHKACPDCFIIRDYKAKTAQIRKLWETIEDLRRRQRDERS